MINIKVFSTLLKYGELALEQLILQDSGEDPQISLLNSKSIRLPYLNRADLRALVNSSDPITEIYQSHDFAAVACRC